MYDKKHEVVYTNLLTSYQINITYSSIVEFAMADLDRAKDFINNIRLYMTMCLALIISIGSGISKMYVAENFSYIFFVGNILLVLLLFIFIFLAKKLHKKTDELKDIK